jgi:prefoldin subunit 5
MYYGPGAQGEPDLDAQRQVLSTQADALQAELDLVKKRLSDLESAGTPE